MPEYLEFLQGRRFITFHEAKTRAEIVLGDRPHPAPKRPLLSRVWRWFRRMLRCPLPEPVARTREPLPRIHFGGFPVPDSEVTGHFLIGGSTGSGKTVLVETTLFRVLTHLEPGSDHRAIVYDAKREWFSRFQSLNLRVPIHYIDPFDSRGSAWDIGKDIRSRAEAMQVAAAMIPRAREDTDKFWINSTRNILGAVIQRLAETTNGNFTFRDVLLVMRSRERLSFVLGSHPDTAHLWSEATADEKTMANLMATFHSHLQKFEVVAALWEHATRKFSIREWAASESVLLLAGHPVYREALTPIHQVLLNLAADRLLNVPDSRTRRSWLFLDEFRNLGRITSIYHLANEGRSKGVVLFLGFQSFEGLKEVYGENVANEILGQIRNKIFLRTNSAATADWAEKHFGRTEWLVESVTNSTTSSRQGGSSSASVAHSRRRESALLGSTLMSLPPPGDGRPIQGFYDIPVVGAFTVTADLPAILERLPKADPSIPNTLELPTECQRLMEWTDNDRLRLSLPVDLLLGHANPHVALLSRIENLKLD